MEEGRENVKGTRLLTGCRTGDAGEGAGSGSSGAQGVNWKGHGVGVDKAWRQGPGVLQLPRTTRARCDLGSKRPRCVEGTASILSCTSSRASQTLQRGSVITPFIPS